MRVSLYATLFVWAGNTIVAAHAQSSLGIDTLRVGADPDFRPISFSDSSGTLTGFDADFAAGLAKHLNIPLQYQGVAWDGIVPALTGSKIDAITTMVITDKRKEVVAFSDPVMRQDVTEVVRADRTQNPSLEDLKTLKVGAQINTSAQTAATKIPGVNATIYNTVADEYNDLMLGRIDVVLIEDVNAYYSVKQAYEGKLRVTGVPLSSEPAYAGVALRKSDTALLTAVNAAIKAMRADGSLAAVAKKWFGDAGILAPAAQ
ncbi:MAG TPA: transporter substrate-binding domain-containing protein [Dongiaceae bacterium]